MNIENYKFIIFDLDNTLLDFDKSEDVALSKLLLYLKITDVDAINKYKNINNALWLQVNIGNISVSNAQISRFDKFIEYYKINGFSGNELNEMYLKLLTENVIEFNDTYQVLEKLSKDKKICIASNGTDDIQCTRINKSSFKGFIHKVFTSEALGIDKSKMFYIAILTILNVSPTDVLMIGDNIVTDIMAAQQAGIDTCFLRRRSNRDYNNSEYCEIHDLSELYR